MENTLLVKKTWFDISIKQYDAIQEILKNEGNEVDKTVAILSIVFGMPEEYFEELPFLELKEFIASIDFLQKPVPKAPIPDTIIVKGRTVTTQKEISKLTTTEFINLMHLIENPNNKQFIQLFFKCKEDENFLYENLSIVYLHNLMVFFSLAYNRFIKYILRSLQSKMKMIRIQMRLRKFLRWKRQIHTDGLEVLTRLQKQLTDLGM